MLKLKFYLIVTILGTAVLFAAACTQEYPHPGEARLEVSCHEFIEQNHISKELEVPVGGTLRVTLCSNPTTGFVWSQIAEISNPVVLEQIDHQFVSPEGKNIVGSAGQEIWTFKPLKPGTSTVSMNCSPLRERTEKSEWKFVLTVTVK